MAGIPSDSSDTASDRPGEEILDTDAGGTGERPTVGRIPEVPSEAGTAEEARLGVTDEELADEESEAESDLVKTPKP